MKKILSIIAVAIFIIIGFIYLFNGSSGNDGDNIADTKPLKTEPTGLANPASVNCTKQGGTLTIQKNGKQYSKAQY